MPRIHKRVDGLPCPGCGYLLKGLRSPECPECGIDYRAALRKPPPSASTRLHEYWNDHAWLRCTVFIPLCVFGGFVSLFTFILMMDALGLMHLIQGTVRASALIALWGLGTLLITYLLAFRWTVTVAERTAGSGAAAASDENTTTTPQ